MKYIVEFEDEPCMYEDEVHFYKCIQAPWWGLSERVIERLTPYQPEPDCISRRATIDALHTWFRDGFDEDKWWNSTHVLAAIEGLPSAQQGYKWETCFECPLSHGCPKIKGCTNEQAIERASQIPNDCPLSAQPEQNAYEQGRITGRVEMRTEILSALKEMVGSEVWSNV